MVRPESDTSLVGEEFQAAALYAIEEAKPDGVILDVRFGDARENQFKVLRPTSRWAQRTSTAGLSSKDKIAHKAFNLPHAVG